MPAKSICSAQHWNQVPQEKQATSRLKFVYVRCFKSFVRSNLELPGLEPATCSLLPLYLPVQTWRKKKNHNPSLASFRELSLGDTTVVTADHQPPCQVWHRRIPASTKEATMLFNRVWKGTGKSTIATLLGKMTAFLTGVWPSLPVLTRR